MRANSNAQIGGSDNRQAICPNGICAGGDINGNPTVNNYAPPQRHLSPEFMKEISACLSQKAGTADLSAISGNREAFIYAQDWATVFHNANWKIKDNIIGSFLLGGGGLPTGTEVAFQGRWDNVAGRAIYDSSSPEGQFVQCTLGKSIPGDTVRMTPYPHMPADTVRVMIDPQP